MQQELTQNDEATEERTRTRGRHGERKGERLWTPLFALIVAVTLCAFMVGQGLNSGTSVYLARSGEGAAFAGVLATVFSIAAALTRIACGSFIDKHGRYQALCAGMALLIAGTVVPALVDTPAVFVVCRVVQGIGFSATTTASATAAADVLPLSRLGEGIGYYGLGQALAMSVGPALALFLVSTDPAENLYFGLSAVCVLGFAFALFCHYEHHPERLPATSAYRRKWEARRALETAEGARSSDGTPAATSTTVPVGAQDTNSESSADKTHRPGGLRSVLEPRALPGALPMLVLSPAFGFGIFFVGLYGTSLGVGNPGLFYTLSALSMIAVRLNSKSFMDRVAPLKMLAASTACGIGAFALLLLAAEAGDLPFYLGGIFYGGCLGISSPLNQSVAVKNTPPDRWGATNALFLLATDIGIGTSSIVWGIVNDSFGFGATILCVIGCILASFVVAWFSYPNNRSSA